jgi:hypothetical protein
MGRARIYHLICMAAANNGKALRFHWPTAPFALDSYAYLPGQRTPR